MEFSKFIDEYKFFIKNYIFPLIGHPFKNECLKEDVKKDIDQHLTVLKNENTLTFTIPNSSKNLIVLLQNDISNELIGLLRNVCTQFSIMSVYSYNDSIKRQKVSTTELNHEYNYAVQLGVCHWISEDGNTIEKLLSILEEWSKKTYEGKKVSYSIIVDPNIKSNKNDNFFKFLEDEYSATLTDTITSAFLVSNSGNLIRYISILDDKKSNCVNRYKLISNVPLRFSNLIYKEVINSRVGVFLLTNGDLLISKNREIILVKRNGRWFNFQVSSFINALSDFKRKYKIKKKLLKEIFSTTLDISFSHTGGLIALLTDDDYLSGPNQIVDNYEQLDKNVTGDELEIQIKDSNPLLTDNEISKEAFKRRVKKETIIKLLNDNTKMSFETLERKLRSDLAALDGAFIMKKDGTIASIGSIIQNDKGSSGGGRRAAAKKLSLKGMAIKISTDGYIEVFVEGKLVYSIK